MFHNHLLANAVSQDTVKSVHRESSFGQECHPTPPHPEQIKRFKSGEQGKEPWRGRDDYQLLLEATGI